MRFSVLSSGSKANATYVEGGGKRILVDCGLSGKQAELRLGEIGVDASTLDAIVVSHEHSDHINGVGTLSRRYNLPVFANEQTMQHISKPRGREIFTTGQRFCIGDLEIEPFSVVHDAADPVAFALYSEGSKLVLCTDLGRVTTLVREHLKGANAIVLESNHDQEMLQSCSYRWELKQRIASAHGHICNETAGQLLSEIAHPGLLHVVLGHISERSNTPTLALEAANKYLNTVPEKIRGLETLLCGSIYEGLPCLRLEEATQERLVSNL